MATSVYKGDQLKKNPLLGTATYSVDSLAPRKERLMSLYGEAKSMAGQGRSGMEGVLAGRYARFAESDQAALGDLRSRYSGLQTQSASMRDPEKESKFASDIADFATKSQKKHRYSKKKRQFFGSEQARVEAEQVAYEQNISDNVKRLQGEGAPLAAEYDRKAGALQQQIDDYNLFLGSY